MGTEQRNRLHTDLEFSDYLRYPAGIAEVRAGVESWLREAIIAPFSYEGSILNGEFQAFGQGMVRMAEHGLAERVGQVGQARAEADLQGIGRIELWLKNNARDGDMIVLLSPPGTEAEGFGVHGERRLSFTQFGVARIDGKNRTMRMVSVPEREIPIVNHVRRVEEVWGRDVGPWLSTVEQTDRGLVGSPFVIPKEHVQQGLDLYARKMGKAGWSQVEAEIRDGLRLAEDEKSEQRRRSLIDTITWQVGRYVEERDAARLNNIGLVARIVMAREAAGKYFGLDPERLLEEYTEIEAAKWFHVQVKKGGILRQIGDTITHGAEAVQAYRVLRRLQQQLSQESDVTEMLMGSSCGGGGIPDLLEGENMGRFGVAGNYLDTLASRAQSLQKGEISTSHETMKCVKCPFCHKTVDAVVTESKIECPKCHRSASR